MWNSRNHALALALVALAVLFYAITVARMTEREERRHAENPQAHADQGRPGSAR